MNASEIENDVPRLGSEGHESIRNRTMMSLACGAEDMKASEIENDVPRLGSGGHERIRKRE